MNSVKKVEIASYDNANLLILAFRNQVGKFLNSRSVFYNEILSHKKKMIRNAARYKVWL